MNIQFTGKNMDITPAIRTFTTEKLSKGLARFADTITSVHIIFKVDKLRQIVDATIGVAGNQINAQAESESIYKSIDLLKDRLISQLNKHKEKESKHRV